jgi:membrane protein implicated in regulation of membrane protease activity
MPSNQGDVMNPCAKCETTTEGGQFYRFYYGVVVDVPESRPTPEGKPVQAGPVFQARGSEEVYFCDRCLVWAAAREEKIRSGFFLVLGLFAILVVAFLVLASTPALWFALVLLLVIAALGGAAYQRYRHLQAALRAQGPGPLRHAVSSSPKLQRMGDEWAIAYCRQALQEGGAELFLTREEKEVRSQP